MQSIWLSAILFVMLLWHPIALTATVLFVLRDVIYYAQVLIFVAAFGYSLLAANPTGKRLAFAAVSGAVLGWLWLTREEGLWLVPAIALIAAVAIIRAYRAAAFQQTAVTLTVVAGVFAAIAGTRIPGVTW
jgi:hypothetical protein